MRCLESDGQVILCYVDKLYLSSFLFRHIIFIRLNVMWTYVMVNFCIWTCHFLFMLMSCGQFVVVNLLSFLCCHFFVSFRHVIFNLAAV